MLYNTTCLVTGEKLGNNLGELLDFIIQDITALLKYKDSIHVAGDCGTRFLS